MRMEDIFPICHMGHMKVFDMLPSISADVSSAARVTQNALESGNKIMFCGNGGSAADSQHLAAEFVGKFLKNRRPLPAMSLTVNTSQITAVGNDFCFDEIFQRELVATGKKGDVLFALSTSGNSLNVVAAAKAAREMGVHVIGMTGSSGGELKQYCDICICVPSNETPRIQEAHIFIGHAICEYIEKALC